jgi:hypothetical protein
MDKLKDNLPEADFREMKDFIDDVSKTDGVLLQTGIGEKIPSLSIGFAQQGKQFPLYIEANGKVAIAYYNVNATRPYPPQMSEAAAKKIRDLLGEQKKLWHFIRASSKGELTNKLWAIVKILTET